MKGHIIFNLKGAVFRNIFANQRPMFKIVMYWNLQPIGDLCYRNLPALYLRNITLYLSRGWLVLSIEIEGQKGKVVSLKHYLGVWQHSVPPEICPTKALYHQ